MREATLSSFKSCTLELVWLVWSGFHLLKLATATKVDVIARCQMSSGNFHCWWSKVEADAILSCYNCSSGLKIPIITAWHYRSFYKWQLPVTTKIQLLHKVAKSANLFISYVKSQRLVWREHRDVIFFSSKMMYMSEVFCRKWDFSSGRDKQNPISS